MKCYRLNSIFYFKKLILFIILFPSLLCADIKWTNSLNFVIGTHENNEMNAWHTSKILIIHTIYKATRNHNLFRNVAMIRISVFYQDDANHTHEKYLDIPYAFISGWNEKDIGGKKRVSSQYFPTYATDIYTFQEFIEKLRTFYPEDSSEGADLRDARFDRLEDGSTRTKPSSAMAANYFHTESNILFFLEKCLVSRTEEMILPNGSHSILEKLLEGIPPESVISGLLLTIASYRDMCKNCESMLTREQEQKTFFINGFKDKIINLNYKLPEGKETLPFYIAYSGMKPYSSSEGVSSRENIRLVITNDPVNLAPEERSILHKENR